MLMMTPEARPMAASLRAPTSKPALQRCACGGAAGPSGECEECRKKRELQRSGSGAGPAYAPPSVHEVVRSPGHPLDPGVRAAMEPRFGQSFADVRVHSDAAAAESAQAVGAQAYTVGMHLAFGAARYSPGSGEGRRLLAHELAHVVQQRDAPAEPGSRLEVGAVNDPAEAEAERAADEVTGGGEVETALSPASGVAPLRRDDGGAPAQAPPAPPAQAPANPAALDSVAQAIVTRAQDQSRPAADRAVELVNSIISTYYAGQAGNVAGVVYDNAAAGTGVRVDQVQSGGSNGVPITYRGTINVGDSFLNQATASGFARRVLQVGHELQHIRQWQSGMVGANRSDEREFLAFHTEALATELPGTGVMNHSTRARLIDAALGRYLCLSGALQTQYATQRQELLTRRPQETQHGYTAPVPTACTR